MRERKPRRIPLDLSGIAGPDRIFRLNGAVKRDPAVDRWLMDNPADLRTIARTWFEQMRMLGEDVRELMHDGCPVACIDDAAFAYVNTFKSHVNVGFFHGASLDDPSGLLEGHGKRMRHVKVTPDSEINVAALNKLIDAAYTDIKARLREAA